MKHPQFITKFKYKPCISCNGRGAIGHQKDWHVCKICDGVGTIEHIFVVKINGNMGSNKSAA